MTKNSESQATTITGQTTAENSTVQNWTVNDVDMSNYVEKMQSLKISKSTATFIASIRVLSDLYGLVQDGLVLLYGGDKDSEIAADKTIQGKYGKISSELDTVLYEFLNESIKDNITDIEIKEI